MKFFSVDQVTSSLTERSQNNSTHLLFAESSRKRSSRVLIAGLALSVLAASGCGVLRTRSQIDAAKQGSNSQRDANNSVATQSDGSAQGVAGTSTDNQNGGTGAINEQNLGSSTDPQGAPSASGQSSAAQTSAVPGSTLDRDLEALGGTPQASTSNTTANNQPALGQVPPPAPGAQPPVAGQEYGAKPIPPAPQSPAYGQTPPPAPGLPPSQAQAPGMRPAAGPGAMSSGIEPYLNKTYLVNYGASQATLTIESPNVISLSTQKGPNSRTVERVSATISGLRPGVFMITGRKRIELISQ